MNIIYNFLKLIAGFGITISFAQIAIIINQKAEEFLNLFSGLNIYVAFGTALVGFLFLVIKVYTYIKVDMPNKRKREKLEIELMIQDLKIKTRENIENKLSEVEQDIGRMKKKLNKMSYG